MNKTFSLEEKPVLRDKIAEISAKFGVSEKELVTAILEYVLANEELVLEAVKSHLGTEPEHTAPG
jgi:diaminopimelate decarboxylase